MKRRPVSPFSLSFLDIMFCGFGAVVLLVLILNTDTVRARNQTFADLRAEVVKLEQQALIGRKNLVTARTTLQSVDQELVLARSDTERTIQNIQEMESAIAHMNRETLASREQIQRLTSDLQRLEQEQKRRAADEASQRDQGDKIRTFKGEADRQYLTGLKMGGRHILILVDASASMLDETIVAVVRRRNMEVAEKRNAPKWKRALGTAEWLVSNLPASADFQLYLFNTSAGPVLPGSGGQWLNTSSRKDVDAAVEALQQSIPAGGTSLYHAFAAVRDLAPKPDNILLITDGLPTQGKNRPKGTTVTAEQRLKHFEQAVGVLPADIPVNTILLPMEGDAYAAAAYWKLAIDSRGSFITPARDWP